MKNNVKKLLIAIALIVAVVVICVVVLNIGKDDDSSHPTNTSTTPAGTSSSVGGGDSSGDENDNPIGDSTKKVFQNQIENIGGFYGDLAFVTMKSNTGYKEGDIVCIDKQGYVQFVLSSTTDEQYEYVIGSDWENRFSGNYAYIYRRHSDGSRDNVLCDKEGKLIKPEDLGATRFLTGKIAQEMFLNEGYILAMKTTTSFTGSVDEVAIFNNKLEKVLDYSFYVLECTRKDTNR